MHRSTSFRAEASASPSAWMIAAALVLLPTGWHWRGSTWF
jgi:hypothetical protein